MLVVTALNSPAVVAYYGWCMAHLVITDAPERLTKGAGRYPQPVALLARLCVHDAHVGRGLGAGLLQDVFLRMLAITDNIGCRCLLIHCDSAAAKDFYLHLVPGFVESPTDPMHLIALLKDIRKSMPGFGAG